LLLIFTTSLSWRTFTIVVSNQYWSDFILESFDYLTLQQECLTQSWMKVFFNCQQVLMENDPATNCWVVYEFELVDL